MDLWEMTAVDVRPELTDERQALLDLLGALTSEQWHATTKVPGWTVKDLALHVLDDDLGWLSRGRDRDASGRLEVDDDAAFVAALAAKNQRWIDGTRGLSRPVVTGLLGWAGHQMDAYYSTLDLTGEGRVSWASDGPVPAWFDIAQDLTERWVHQMQMREALGLVGGYRDAYLPVVLRTFVWALPHQLAADAATGTTVTIDLSSGGLWHLISGEGGWTLHEGAAVDPIAELWCSDDGGWRWLTGASVAESDLQYRGPAALGAALRRVRGILA